MNKFRAVWRSMDQGDQLATVCFAAILPLVALAVMAVMPS